MVFCISQKSVMSVIEDIHQHLNEGEEVKVKVVEIDKLGRVRVSKTNGFIGFLVILLPCVIIIKRMK